MLLAKFDLFSLYNFIFCILANKNNLVYDPLIFLLSIHETASWPNTELYDWYVNQEKVGTHKTIFFVMIYMYMFLVMMYTAVSMFTKTYTSGSRSNTSIHIVIFNTFESIWFIACKIIENFPLSCIILKLNNLLSIKC